MNTITQARLASTERGTGDLLKSLPEPFRLMGQSGVDWGRIQQDKAKAQRLALEAAELAGKQQLALI